MIALLLAAALALPKSAEAVRIDEHGWPEKVAEVRGGERVWWWSGECAPQLLGADVTVECTQPRMRRVQVLDRASGKNLAGVRVIWGSDAMRADLPDALLPAALTNEQGEALLPLLPTESDSERVHVRVDGPRVASWWQRIVNGTAAVRLDAVPAAATPTQLTIEGRESATRARVQLAIRADPDAPRSWAITPDGRMTLPILPPVPMLVTAWSDASAPLVMELDLASAPRAIDLPRGSVIEGRIVDSRGRPLEAATIEGVIALGKLPRGLRRRTRSSRDGTFALRGIPTGAIQLKVRKEGRATLLRTIDAAADPHAGDLTLRAARRIAFHVLDAEGRAIPHAVARVTGGPSATADRNGNVRIDSVDAEDDVVANITARGFRATEITIATDDAAAHDVVLSRGVRVLANLVDAEGGSAGAGDVLVNNNGTQRVIAFEENGSIDIGGLDAGKLALEIRAHGAAPLVFPSRPVIEDETVDLGIVQLDEGSRLTGRVLDRDHGAPLAGAHIRVLRRSGRDAALAAVMNDWIDTTAAEDGTFAIRGLTAQPHLAWFDAPGHAPRLVELAVDGERIDVVLDRARTLNIECKPVRRCGSEARVLYAGASHPWAATSATMTDGHARILSAAPGTTLLRLAEGGQIVHEREIRVGTSTETTVQLELASATLRGTVATSGRPRRDGGFVELRARTAPAAGLPIFVEQRTPDGSALGGGWQSELPSMLTAPLDSAGEFVFEELEPGEYDAIYRRDGKSSSTSSIRVGAGTSRVVLDVSPGELRGRVLRSDGLGASFARVAIIDASGTRSSVLSDRLGTFEAMGIAEGRARVIATSDDAEASVEVDVDRAQAASVEMVMRPRAIAGSR